MLGATDLAGQSTHGTQAESIDCVSKVPLTGSSRHNASLPPSNEVVAAGVRTKFSQTADLVEAAVLKRPELSLVVKPLLQQLESTIMLAAARKAEILPNPNQVPIVRHKL